MRITVFFTLAYFLIGCGGNENSNSSPEEVIPLPKYSIYDEEIYDAPIKTQVTLDVIIEEDEINDVVIRELLNGIFIETMNRKGFNYRTNPSSAYIYVFTTREKAQSGMGQWVGMISKSHDDIHPTIKVDETQLKSVNETKESKWGLSYEQRQELWNEIIRSEDRAQRDAEKKYPLDKPGLTADDIKKNGDLSKKLNDKYDNEIAVKHELKIEILDSIALEGLVNGWAFPEYEQE